MDVHSTQMQTLRDLMPARMFEEDILHAPQNYFTPQQTAEEKIEKAIREVRLQLVGEDGVPPRQNDVLDTLNTELYRYITSDPALHTFVCFDNLLPSHPSERATLVVKNIISAEVALDNLVALVGELAGEKSLATESAEVVAQWISECIKKPE